MKKKHIGLRLSYPDVIELDKVINGFGYNRSSFAEMVVLRAISISYKKGLPKYLTELERLDGE